MAYDHELYRKVDRLLDIVERIDRRTSRMEVFEMAAMDDLLTQLKAETDAEQAVLALVNGLVAQVAAAQGDPAKIQAAIAQMKANTDALVAATLAGTPVTPSNPATP